jgi:gliding motility-associated-like protein
LVILSPGSSTRAFSLEENHYFYPIRIGINIVKVASIVSLLVFIFLMFPGLSSGQCSGNVLFLENFGGGAAAPVGGPALAPGITSYTFDPVATISDGEYGIRKTSADLSTGVGQYGSWHVGTDHSGSEGYMMVVNADFTAGKFYETQINNLCAGSTLYFSAWIANLIRAGSGDPLDPILRFEISSTVSGTVLASYTTPPIPRFASFTWTQYGVNLSLPTTESSVILRIFNSQVGGAGNDLCLDDIEFSLCGPSIEPVLSGAFASTSDACSGSNLSFSGNVAAGFYASPAYQWQFNSGTGWNNLPGATNVNYAITAAQPVNSGRYRLLVAESGNINSINCRSVSPEIALQVFDPQLPILESQQVFCERDTLQINISSPVLSVQWSNAGGNVISTTNPLQIPNSSLSDDGNYNANVITPGGCTASGTLAITIRQNQLVQMTPPDTLLCDNAILALNVNQPLATGYLWNDGSTDTQRNLSDANTYQLLTTDGVCRRNDSFTITRNVSPSVSLPADTTVCANETFILTANAVNADSYLWNNNSTDSFTTIAAAGIIDVTVTNTCGTDVDEMLVTFIDCADVIFVPNAFTPNGDGLNDLLTPKAFFFIQSIQFRVFNRWGQELFVSNSLNEGWNGFIKGKQAEPGLYIWQVQYIRNDKTFTQQGTSLLIK